MKRLLVGFVFLTLVTIPGISSASVIGKSANNLGLVGYWPLNEGTGTQAGDASGKGNTGTLINAPTWTTGKLGKALFFDSGSLQQVNAGPIPALSNASAATICAWVYRGSPSNTVAVGLAALSTANSFDVQWYSDGNIYFTFSNNDASEYSEAGLSGTGWHHACEVFDGSLSGNARVAAYIDGVYAPLGYHTPPPATLPSSAAMGAFTLGYDAAAFNSDGIIDEARVYNRALSATEIAALYKSGAANIGASSATLQNGSTLTSGLVGHWTFDGPDVNGQGVYDRSGQSNNVYFYGGSISSAKVMGKLGQALNFNGTSNYVNVPLSLTGAGSFSFWAKPSTSQPSASGFPPFLSGANDSELEFGFQTAGGPLYYASTLYFATTYTPDNAWHLFTIASDGTNMKLYIDGVYKETVSFSFAVTTLNIAVDVTPFYYKGVIDDVRVYNRSLTAAEVKQLYNLGSTKINASSQTLTNGSTLTSGLVGLWSFDGPDVTDRVYDRSGQANNGNFIGGSTSSAKVQGKIGQGLQFDGSSSYVNIPSSSTFSQTSFTMSAWVYIPTAIPSGWRAILEHNNGGVNWYGLWKSNNANVFHCRAKTGSGQGHDYSTPIVANTWYLVTCTHDNASGTTVLYLNGAQDGSYSDGSETATDDVLTIGESGNGEFFNGKIDDVRTYSRALSASEVKQLYNIGR